ncbi:MAG: HAMP domain-containing sensor histidine kinase [Myxococcota bacterium]
MSVRTAIAVVVGASSAAVLAAAVSVAGWVLNWPPMVAGVVCAAFLIIATCLTGALVGLAIARPVTSQRLPAPVETARMVAANAETPSIPLRQATPSQPPRAWATFEDRATDVDEDAQVPPNTIAALHRALERLAKGQFTDLHDATAPLPDALTDALTRAADRWQEDRRMAHERIERLRKAREKDSEERETFRKAMQNLSDEVTASTQVRDAFLSRMSHELRTPLNAILGYIEMLDEDLEDEDLRGDVHRIRSSAANLLGTITAVLDLTQLESGAYSVLPQEVDLDGLVREVERAVNAEAVRNGNALEVRVMPGVGANLDRRMVHSILLNLLSNACKYTKNGTVKLLVAEVDNRVRILVTDTGIGMTPRQIEAALTPFSQADDSSTRRYDGTGLGLSVVHGFVEAMGGTLGITSQPGHGATVDVELPRDCAHIVSDAENPNLLDEQPTMLAR